MKQSDKKSPSSDSTYSKLNEYDQHLLIDIIGGKLNQAEVESFNYRLAEDKILAKECKRQFELDSILPVGTAPYIDPARLKENHWSTHRALRQQVSGSLSVASLFGNLWNIQVSMRSQLVGVIVAFGAGLLIATTDSSNVPLSNLAVDSSEQSFIAKKLTQKTTLELNMLPVRMIKEGDFEITNLSIDKIDQQSGAITLTYSLTSQTSVEGNIANPNIQGLLASTIRNDVRDATRLSLVEVLTQHVETSQIREALSNSLLNDPNPGVRIVAAESLVKLSRDSEVRKVLRKSLETDVNPGVRVKAFQALVEYSSENETQQTFKQFSINDSNQFIREQAKKLVTL